MARAKQMTADAANELVDNVAVAAMALTEFTDAGHGGTLQGSDWPHLTSRLATAAKEITAALAVASFMAAQDARIAAMEKRARDKAAAK